MRCEQVRDLLSAYIDGMTSDKENNIINNHLKKCSQCQEELEELRVFCAALKKLPVPDVPEQFIQDLRKHLAEEKTLLFVPKKVKKPHKKSWIAASVAGLALAAGIYASTVLPFAPMIASWQEKHNQQVTNKPSIAINDIINRIYNGKEKDKTAEIAQIKEENTKAEDKTTPNTSANRPPVAKNTQKDPTPNSIDTTIEPPVSQEVTPKVSDMYTTHLNVDKAGESLEEVVQLAQTNGWDYEYFNNSSKVQTLSGPNATGLAIKVNQNDVDDVLNVLEAIGESSAPERSSLELTEQYNEVVKHISLLKEQKQSLQQEEDPDESKINEIEQQLQNYLKQKNEMDKDLEMVKINVYFVEELKP